MSAILYALLFLLLAGCASDGTYTPAPRTGYTLSDVQRQYFRTLAQPVQSRQGMNCVTTHDGNTSYTECH